MRVSVRESECERVSERERVREREGGRRREKPSFRSINSSQNGFSVMLTSETRT